MHPSPLARGGNSSLLHERVDHLLLARLFECHGELVALDVADGAVAELDVEDAVVELVVSGGGGFGDGDEAAFAFDHLGNAGRAAAVVALLGAPPAGR